MHSIAGTYTGVSKTQAPTYAQMCMQCQSCSLALQLSGQVFLLLRISNMSRSYTYTQTHTQTPRRTNFSWWQFVLPPSTETCVHSNQESRHSGTHKPRQLLVSTGKMCSSEFLLFCLWCKSLSCMHLGFPSIMSELDQEKQDTVGIFCVRF